MPKLRIDEVYDGDDGPIILNFQNGYANQSIENSECCLLKNDKDSTESVAIASDNMIYTGDIDTEDLCNTFLLTRNKKTGKVRLIKVRTANIKPILQQTKRTSDTLNEKTSALELSRTFGSKKHKQSMEHREKLKVDSETVMEQMKNIAANTTLENIKEDMSDYTGISENFYIPPINRKANTISEVYDLDEILSPEIYDKITSEIENKDIEKELNPFVRSLVAKQKLGTKETVLALYASALMLLYKNVMKDISKKNYVVCKCSHTLNDIILENFLSNVNNKRLRPPMYKDKALCHAMVMCLLIGNYKFNVEMLASEMKISNNLVSQKAKVTGATTVTVEKQKFIQLKLPLGSAGKLFNRRKSTMF